MTEGDEWKGTELYNRYEEEFAKYGAIGIEMEAAELYTLAAQFNRKALAICTVSDSMVSEEKETTAEERQTTFKEMMLLALDTIISE